MPDATPPLDILERNASVTMATEDLAAAPVYKLPAGFSMRRFRRGDEATWVKVQQTAEHFQKIDEALFFRQYGDNFERHAARIMFLMDIDGEAIGTISAWNDAEYSRREYGRIHWVAIVPPMQGRGLGKPLMSAACRRLLELGHERAYLTTSTARVPAINLYLAFGFEPVMRHEEERVLWTELMPRLSVR